MSEIKRQDIISDDALKAPLELTKGLEGVVETLDKLIPRLQDMSKAVQTASTPSKIKKETEELTLAQVELEKISKQIATAQARNNDEYRKQEAALAGVKKELKEKNTLGERDAKTVSAQNSSYKQLEAALAKNRDALKNMSAAQRIYSQEGKELAEVVNRQDQELKELAASMGQHQLQVGNYKGAILEALGPLGDFTGMFGQLPQAMSATSTAMGGATKASGLLRVAMMAIPIFLIIGAITALITYFTKTEDGANKLKVVMAGISMVFDAITDVVIGLGRSLTELSLDKVKQGFKDMGEAVKNFVLSRIELLMGAVGGIGESFRLLFKGEFKEAAKVAGKSMLDLQRALNPVVMLGEALYDGFNNAKDALGEFYDETKKKVEDRVRLQQMENQLNLDKRRFMIEEEKLTNKLMQARERALDAAAEDTEKLEAQKEALETLNVLSEKRIRLKEREQAINKAIDDLAENDTAANEKAAELQRDLIALQNQALAERKKTVKAISDLEEKIENDRKKREKEAIDQQLADAKLLAETKIFEAQRAVDEEIAVIKKAVIEGKKTREQGEKDILEIRRRSGEQLIRESIEQTRRLLDEQIKAEEEKLLITNLTEDEITDIKKQSGEERLRIQKQLAKLERDLIDEQYKYLEDSEKNQLANIAATLSKVLELYDQFSTAIVDMFASFTDRRVQQIDQEIAAEQAKRDTLMAQYEGDKNRQAEIEEAYEKRQAALEEKKRRIQTRQARLEKAQALIRAAMNTAVAVTTALSQFPGPPATIPFAALAGALGAIQIAAIAAKPIPQFAEGTASSPAGLAIVGEEGAELMRTPGGKVMLSPEIPTMVNLQAGTEIIPHEQTMALLALNGLVSTSQHRNNDSGREIVRTIKNLENVIRNKRELIVNGRVAGYRKSGTRVEYIESLRNRT